MQTARWLKEVKAFLYSYHFSNGLRTSLSVVVPSVIFAMQDRLDVGIAISMGALCTALADVPGTIIHKRNGLLISTTLIFITALVTGLVASNTWLTAGWVAVCVFFYSMLLVYGNRGGNIGIGCLLVMVSTIGEQLPMGKAIEASFLVLSGCIWYSLLALLLWQIRPYLTIQQTLGDCIQETADYLRLRANFYKDDIDITENYKSVLAQQVLVNERQEAVRELLLKMRSAQQGTTSISKSMVLIFLHMTDMQEEIMASQIDYTSLQKNYKGTPLLAQLHNTILQVTEELEAIGMSVAAGQRSLPKMNLKLEIEKVKREIDAYRQRMPTLRERSAKLLPLTNVVDNLQHIAQRIYNLHRLTRLERVKDEEIDPQLELSRFTTRQRYDFETFRNNLSFNSHLFRHGIRTSLAMVTGYLLGHALDISRTYWILLTIVVIMKPGFSMTKSRSYQRMIGTIIGALFAVGVLFLTQNHTAIFIIMLICIIGAYSTMTYNYTVSVVFTTPFIVFLLHFLYPADFQNISLRVLDTLIGGAIAFTFNYIFWPSWEYRFLPDYMFKMLHANRQYFLQIMKLYTGQAFSMNDYKLARKEVHVSTANLMAAFQRMLSEPKNKQKNASEVYHFVVLSHSLSSHIAQLAHYALQHQIKYPRVEYPAIADYIVSIIDQVEHYMQTGAHIEDMPKLGAFQELEGHLDSVLAIRQEQINLGQGHTPAREEMLEIKHVRDQLHAIYSVLKDMKKAAVHASAITQN